MANDFFSTFDSADGTDDEPQNAIDGDASDGDVSSEHSNVPSPHLAESSNVVERPSFASYPTFKSLACWGGC